MLKKISLIVVLFILPLFPQQQEINIISSGNNSLTFEYYPQFKDSSVITVNGESFIKLNLSGSLPMQEVEGMPDVPVKVIPLGVPSEYGNTAEVLSSDYYEIAGKISPVPFFKKDESGMGEAVYKLSGNYYAAPDNNDDIVSFGSFGISRGVPVQDVIIKPVVFYSTGSRIRIYKKIVIRINFPSGQATNNVKADDELLQSSLINYDAAKRWGKKSNTARKTTAGSNALLATGKWFRFEAPDEGIYKITRSMLTSYGIDASSVDPRKIKIYNGGGGEIPENPEADMPMDLNENAVYISGEDDGRFDDADYILFYGRGTSFWNYNKVSKKIERVLNRFSNKNYYWVTVSDGNGKRMEDKAGLTEAAVVKTTTPGFAFWDEDKINASKSGKTWMGDEFSDASKIRTYMTALNGFVPGTKIYYRAGFFNTDDDALNLVVAENGTNIFNSFIAGRGSMSNGDYVAGNYTTISFNYEGSVPESRSVLRFTLNTNDLSSKGYIDYFNIEYTKSLQAADNNLIFFSPDTSAQVEYDLSGFTNSYIKVFDVSDYAGVKMVSAPVLQSGSDYHFISSEKNDTISKYIAVTESNYKSPANPVEMENSNVHGIAGADLIIITPKIFLEEANRLKEFKENHPILPLKTVVVDVDQVYNEFSSGMVDVGGIRNFIKYAYNNWDVKPKYVLLFGDATYDYRNIEGIGNNYIITYESEDFYSIYTYSNDDYFVYVDGNDKKVDLAIGRFNIQTTADAANMVDKVIAYEKNENAGMWQNLVTLVADDNYGPNNSYEPNWHIGPSESLSSQIPKSFDQKKVYLEEYPDVITSLGRTKPGATAGIVKAINDGTLLLNYYGHGSPEVWAHERVFDKSTTIPLLTNSNYFFLTAGTCDFGYYDLPADQSGAEMLVLKANSGAIGAFTASRLVFANENASLNETFYSKLLSSARDTLYLPVTLGQAYFSTKVIEYTNNSLKYSLFGDPSLRLAVPHYKANIDKVNGIDLASDVQIKALSSARVEGTILKADGTAWTDFNGEGTLSIYDSEQLVNIQKINFNVRKQGGIIFRGRVSVTNGNFSSGFVVPKDISYQNQNGKIALFFSSGNSDGLGYSNKIIVGGTDSTAVNDGKGPDIEVYFDDPSYKDAYLINPNSQLIVKLADETGLNTTGAGVGHRLEAVLNDNETEPIDLTSYFTGDLDAGGKSGEVKYKFNNLAQGDYSLRIKAWDVYNNLSTQTVTFSVVDGSGLVVRDLFNYPNPFSGSTTFTFNHNLSGSIDVQIKIYTVAGRMIKKIEDQVNSRFAAIPWDGRDEDGNRIANGTYFYKVIIKSAAGDYNKSITGKLAVIR